MTSRFGPLGACLKRLLARAVRFITLEQREIDAAQDSQIAALADRVSGFERVVGSLRCDLGEMRGPILSAVARDIVVLRVRSTDVEEAVSRLASRDELRAAHAEVTSAERRTELRIEAEADRVAARISELLRECDRLTDETKRLEAQLDARAEHATRIERVEGVVASLDRRLETLALLIEIAQRVDEVQVDLTRLPPGDQRDQRIAVLDRLSADMARVAGVTNGARSTPKR